MKQHICLYCLIIGTCLPCSAQVDLHERFEYYPITPATLEELKSELANKSPVSKNQLVYHGGTQWKLSPAYVLQVENNLCYLRQITIRLEGTYTMPKLADGATDTALVKERFERFYQGLLAHEKGHQSLWFEAAQKISDVLKAMPGQYHCKKLSMQANMRINTIVKAYQQHNQQYDKRTVHGQTQGASIGRIE